MNTLKITAMAALFALPLAACQDDASIASRNLSKAADNFEVQRRIVFINGISDNYLFEVIGRCSVTPNGGKLDVTCKHGPNDFRKHFLGISDNTPYLVEQLDGINVSTYHTRITFKPQSIVPNVDFRGDANELFKHEDTGD